MVSVTNITAMRWHCKFKGLSQDGGRVDFSNNLHASLLNDDPSNEPNRPDLFRRTVPLIRFREFLFLLGVKGNGIEHTYLLHNNLMT
jgi:hypothetical protein